MRFYADMCRLHSLINTLYECLDLYVNAFIRKEARKSHLLHLPNFQLLLTILEIADNKMCRILFMLSSSYVTLFWRAVY